MEEEEMTVICVPWDQITVKGSTKVICRWCEAICGISPATKKAVGEDPIIMCMDCFYKNVDMSKPPSIREATKEQIEELRDFYE